MTKQEIKSIIDGTISGQGSQVDIGGKLAAVLNGMVDIIPEGGGGAEPLIVRGSLSEGDAGKEFTPSAGQPSFRDALTAYQSGVPVFLAYSDDDTEDDLTELVIKFTVHQGEDSYILETKYTNWTVSSY